MLGTPVMISPGRVTPVQGHSSNSHHFRQETHHRYLMRFRLRGGRRDYCGPLLGRVECSVPVRLPRRWQQSDALADARENQAPALTRASMVFLFKRFISTRSVKSNREVKGPALHGFNHRLYGCGTKPPNATHSEEQFTVHGVEVNA